MIKYKSIRENKLCIFNNIFINGDIATAYYVLYPYNYKVMNLESSEKHVSKVYNAISNLYNSFGEMKISMFQLKNIVSKEEVIASIIKTVKIYDEDYAGFPEEYKKYIKNITKDFSILAITLNVKNSIDIENQNIMFIIKNFIDDFVKTNFSTKITNINEEMLIGQNLKIKNIMQTYAVPANSKLVMNIYINSLFPSYNLIYNDYLIRNKDAILSGVKQEIIPHLGWFEMSNSGIVEFGGEPRVTYGSILSVLQFPDLIMSGNFNINLPGLHVNMKLLPKDKARLKFKRMRAEALQEEEEAEQARARDTDIDENLSLIQKAIRDIDNGRVIVEVNANILLISDTKADLEAQKRRVITQLSSSKVVCSIAGNQSREFINSFVKNNPNNYDHLMDLEYALSFQLDSGALVGDQDSKFAAPVIGTSEFRRGDS